MSVTFFDHKPAPPKYSPEAEMEAVPHVEFVSGLEVKSTHIRIATEEDKVTYAKEWKEYLFLKNLPAPGPLSPPEGGKSEVPNGEPASPKTDESSPGEQP